MAGQQLGISRATAYKWGPPLPGHTTVLGSDWNSVNPYFTISSSSAYFFMARNGVSRGIDW